MAVELKFRLAADVIKFYRNDPEERALADLLLYQLGLSVQEAQQLNVDELEQLIANLITCNDDVPLPPRGKDKGVRRTNDTGATRRKGTNDTHDYSGRLKRVDAGAGKVSERDAAEPAITD